MKYEIPRVSQCNENSCASANYTMVANALGFPLGLTDVLEITHGTLGQPQFWNWCLDQSVKIRCYSKNDYNAWAHGGSPEWAKKTARWVVKFFSKRTNDKFRDSTIKFRSIIKNPNFKFQNVAPNFDIVKSLFKDGYVIELMCDGWLIYGEKPQAQLLHRVFVTDIVGETLYFHDPSADGVANFKTSKLDVNLALSVDGAEVVGYKRMLL